MEAVLVFNQDRVQQRPLRRSLTFLLVEVLAVFSPDGVPQRLPLRMLSCQLVEVCTVYAQDRVFLRFLNLNTAMMLFDIHAVLKSPSQDRAQQPEVELVIAGLLDASSCCLRHQGVASSTPTRWPEFGDAAFGGCPVPVSWQGHFAARAVVTFFVRTGPDGFMEANDIKAAVQR